MKRRTLDVVFRLREIERRSARSAVAQSLLLEYQASVAQINIAAKILAEASFPDQNEVVASTAPKALWFLQAQSLHAAAATIHADAQVAMRHAVAGLAKSQSALRIVNVALDQHALQQHGEMVNRHQRELDELRYDPVPR